MMNYIDNIKNSLLFKHIGEDEIISLLLNAQYYVKYFEKNEIILHEGKNTQNVGIIIEGEVVIYLDDMDGNSFLKSKLTKGNSFAHVFAITSKPSNCNVISSTATTILFLNINKLIESNNNQIKNNLIYFLATNAYNTSEHLITVSLKTLRKKIFSYLINFCKKENYWFEIPLNRQQMAHYLGINRTSLSKELASLKEEGIINYKKNKFVFLNYEYIKKQV